MWMFVGAAVVGALAMGRTKSKTRLHKLQVLGVRSGRTYKVEEQKTVGCLFVHSPDGGLGVFHRQRNNTFTMVRSQGHPDDIALMRMDFEHAQLPPGSPQGSV